jgi:hypothetical protein
VLPLTLISQASQNCKPQHLLTEELSFYESYAWCVNPYLTVREAIVHLGEEVGRLSVVLEGWQTREVTTNIFLLSCGLVDCVEEYLVAAKLRMPERLRRTVMGRGADRFVEFVSERRWSRRRLVHWLDQWLSSLNEVLTLIVGEAVAPTRLEQSSRNLTALLRFPLPAILLERRLAAPIPFRRLDLTQEDYLSLAKSFVARFPDRNQPILAVGLRTSGSYVAPLVRAFLQVAGYREVALLTTDPRKGASAREKRALRRFANRGYWALIVDDAPNSSRTLLGAFELAHRAGFSRDKVKYLVPTHPAKPNWYKPLPDQSVITLLPEQWHKSQLLHPKLVERQLREYYLELNFASVSVTGSGRADLISAGLQGTASGKRGERLKRVFEVQLETTSGQKQTRYVLAKSVGWGWLGYHAFLIGHQLSEHVPPVLGLRDGILYAEWIPTPAAPKIIARDLLEASASYVAARVRHLNLPGSAVGMDLRKHNNGSRMLAEALSQAYGRSPANSLARTRLSGHVRNLPCPVPTLIDGNMHPSEWISGPRRPLKTDYEHHGMGRFDLNVIDPAYDLADTILNLTLSREEEQRLIRQYVTASGDNSVEERLFPYKLIAGYSAMMRTRNQLFDSPRGGRAQRDYHRRFMNAWNFLTVQSENSRRS